ncbi:MAG: imelysin family protein [Xenococcaceae cyanobacterium]
MLAKNKTQTLYRRLLLPFACLSVITITGAYSSNSTTSSDRSTQNTNAQANEIELAVVSNFADRVVIPTYNLLVKQAEDLNQAVNTFVSDPNDANLKAAQQAWIETRFPWKKSEAFAFGSPTSLGADDRASLVKFLRSL